MFISPEVYPIPWNHDPSASHELWSKNTGWLYGSFPWDEVLPTWLVWDTEKLPSWRVHPIRKTNPGFQISLYVEISMGTFWTNRPPPRSAFFERWLSFLLCVLSQQKWPWNLINIVHLKTTSIFGLHVNFPERTHLKFKIDTPNCHNGNTCSKLHVYSFKKSYYAIYIMPYMYYASYHGFANTIPSLKLCNISHLKMDAWKTTKVSFWGPAYIQGRLLLVSGRVLGCPWKLVTS